MRLYCFLFFCFAVISTAASCQHINSYSYPVIKDINSENGAVVSAHPLASNAGLQMLKKGGNAIDAAIATQLALAVVYPGAGNIGGGGFMIIHTKDGKNIAIDSRETAPAAASRDMYLDKAGNPMMTLSQNGHLSAGVPGAVAGIFAALKYAKLPLKTLIEPAIKLAEKGFAITALQAGSFNENKENFEQYNFSPVAFTKTTAWKAGDTLVQPELAATLRRIKDNGQAGFYEGETARLLLAEMNKGRGIISAADLKNYQAKERAVTDFNYKGYRIITMPLPSSGGIILQQMLGMISGKNIGAMGFQSPAATQLMIEAERRAYADRAFFLGDPDFVQVPVKLITDSSYLNERMKNYEPGKAGKSNIIKEGTVYESTETTHLCTADKEGNAVSLTTTLNGSYGSKTVVTGAGFLLNNEMDDFSVKPGVPNMYGAVGNEKNAIAPGKRMLSSMTPTIILKNDQPFMIVGTPGGTTITTSVFQSIVNVIDFNLSAHNAVNLPKFHHQWLPDIVFLEKGFKPETRIALENMGYQIKESAQIGRTEMILIKKGKNPSRTFTTVADHRGDDGAAGY